MIHSVHAIFQRSMHASRKKKKNVFEEDERARAFANTCKHVQTHIGTRRAGSKDSKMFTERARERERAEDRDRQTDR